MTKPYRPNPKMKRKPNKSFANFCLNTPNGQKSRKEYLERGKKLTEQNSEENKS